MWKVFVHASRAQQTVHLAPPGCSADENCLHMWEERLSCHLSCLSSFILLTETLQNPDCKSSDVFAWPQVPATVRTYVMSHMSDGFWFPFYVWLMSAIHYVTMKVWNKGIVTTGRQTEPPGRNLAVRSQKKNIKWRSNSTNTTLKNLLDSKCKSKFSQPKKKIYLNSNQKKYEIHSFHCTGSVWRI